MKELNFETPIENITFSQMNAQIQNRLEKAGIKTLGDLVKKTKRELKSIPLFGNKCVLMVEDFLEENGWYLGMEEEKKVLVLPTQNNIDWERRRYEVAKDILSARCFGASLGQVSTREILQSIMLADAFINELIERSGVNDS